MTTQSQAIVEIENLTRRYKRAKGVLVAVQCEVCKRFFIKHTVRRKGKNLGRGIRPMNARTYSRKCGILYRTAKGCNILVGKPPRKILTEEERKIHNAEHKKRWRNSEIGRQKTKEIQKRYRDKKRLEKCQSTN